MRILCGTNFSQSSTHAASVAACLARRANEPLQLVHAFQASPERLRDRAELERVDGAERMLGLEAARLRDLGAVVQTRVLLGEPEKTLVDCAAESDGQLIVVAAERRDEPERKAFHHRVDAIAANAHGPVLVVRDEAPFREWTSGARPLRILLGADTTPTTDAAMRFIEQLRRLGPCEVSALHLFWPPEQFQRLGLSGVRSYIDVDPVVHQTLTRELIARLGETKIVLEPHLGSYGERLARAAVEARADLIVVGSHQRKRAARFWHGSVSRAVLHAAEVSVACVPLPAATHGRSAAEFHSALAATDFSDIGDASIALACAAVVPGGTVHVVHVLPETTHDTTEPGDVMAGDANTSERFMIARAQLRALAPEQDEATARYLVLHVLQSDRPAQAIAQAAERLNVDLICVGTHGRTGVAQVVLGSVAQAVVAHTKRPVLLARSVSA